jgi:hypothetical protein
MQKGCTARSCAPLLLRRSGYSPMFPKQRHSSVVFCRMDSQRMRSSAPEEFDSNESNEDCSLLSDAQTCRIQSTFLHTHEVPKGKITIFMASEGATKEAIDTSVRDGTVGE